MKKEVIRTCIVTNEKLPKNQLLRIVKTKDEQYFIDKEQKIQGRGCYVIATNENIETLVKKKLLNRTLRTNVDKKVYDLLMEQKWTQN